MKVQLVKSNPNITDNYIRWRIKSTDMFSKGTFRTIYLSKKNKIKSVTAKLKDTNETRVQSILFDKKTWTIDTSRKWTKEHMKNKADDLGQIQSPGGDDMPRPVAGMREYKCVKCNHVFQSTKKETKCPLCGGAVKEVKSERTNMKKNSLDMLLKEIILPAVHSNKSLEERMIEKILGVDAFKQCKLIQTVPFFKLAFYSKAINDFIAKSNNEVKTIDLKWGESYIPATYELLETGRDKTEKLLVSGYILTKGEVSFIIHFTPTYGGQMIKIIGKTSDEEYIKGMMNSFFSYVKKNNPWKNEMITPFGKFLPYSTVTRENVILSKELMERVDKSAFSFFNNANKFKDAGIPFKRGIIFSGVPGTGKTMSGKVIMNSVVRPRGNRNPRRNSDTGDYECECLSCGHTLSSNEHCRDNPCPKCGGEMRRIDRPGIGKSLDLNTSDNKGVTFIWVTAIDFGSVGTKYLFDMARELQPAVLFIEDVDRCLKGVTLDTIKTEMDGMNPNDGILTILSTNFPNELPATLIDRPGRFDDVIEFSLPAPIERFKILKMYSNKIDITDKDNSLAKVTNETEGLTPAHLKEIVVSSFLLCDDRPVTIDDLRLSIARIKEIHDKFKFKSDVIDVAVNEPETKQESWNGYKSIISFIKKSIQRINK